MRRLAVLAALSVTVLALTACAGSSKESTCKQVGSLQAKADAATALVSSPDDADMFEQAMREAGDGFAALSFGDVDMDAAIAKIADGYRDRADSVPLKVAGEISDDEVKDQIVAQYAEIAKITLYCDGLF